MAHQDQDARMLRAIEMDQCEQGKILLRDVFERLMQMVEKGLPLNIQTLTAIEMDETKALEQAYGVSSFDPWPNTPNMIDLHLVCRSYPYLIVDNARAS